MRYQGEMSDRPSQVALDVYREVLLDPELRELRREFVTTSAEALAGTAGWAGCDSFLGGGDITFASEPDDERAGAADRHHAFRAVAALIEMAGELATGAVQLLEREQRYASAALIRQLIEAEYLLTAFEADFTRAAEWARSTPDEIRRSFSPKSMRAVGGFSDSEYWRHCDLGGHPSPSSRVLLRFNLAVHPDEDEFLTAAMWGDLAQHLRRIWHRVDSLLSSQHARYTAVRQEPRDLVRAIEERWANTDPLAGPVNFQILDELLASRDEGDSAE